MKIKKKIKFVFGGIIGLILVALIGILISNTIALKNNQIGSFFGYSLSYVPTESMDPTIEPGDTVLIKKGSFDDVKVGDIIVYNDGTRYIIHRVVRINTDGSVTTKGDNQYTNPIEDTTKVTEENYYGKYLKTVNFLNLQSLVKNKNYIFPICIIIFLIILVSEGVSVAKSIKANSLKKLKDIETDRVKQELLEELKQEIISKNKQNKKK